jgi:hypothetical protein
LIHGKLGQVDNMAIKHLHAQTLEYTRAIQFGIDTDKLDLLVLQKFFQEKKAAGRK